MRRWIKWHTNILDDLAIGRLIWKGKGIWMTLLALASHIEDHDAERGAHRQARLPRKRRLAATQQMLTRECAGTLVIARWEERPLERGVSTQHARRYHRSREPPKCAKQMQRKRFM